MAITNVDLWNKIRAAFPNFSNHTAEATKETFTEAGFEQLKKFNVDTLNDFWDLSMRVYLQTINVSDAKDDLDEQGFGETYEQGYGGYIQRMAIMPIKPISPKYKKLIEGKSVDPFVVRKPEIQERFFKQNFDYQSLITMPDDFQFKQIFIDPTGMDKALSGIMLQLENGYKIQKYVNKKEAINAGLNSEQYPLIDTQKIDVQLSDVPTEEELVNLILTIKNTVSAMTVGASSSAFNAMQFPTLQDKSRLKLLVRPEFKNTIEVRLARNTYNASTLDLPIDIVSVTDFGGLKPFKEETFETPLYEVYDDFGAVKGYAEEDGSTEVTVEEQDVFWKDPNENIHAIIADKGWLFESIQNNYRVEPIYNPAGRYRNFWASCPNGAICIDALYNVVVIKNPD